MPTSLHGIPGSYMQLNRNNHTPVPYPSQKYTHVYDNNEGFIFHIPGPELWGCIIACIMSVPLEEYQASQSSQSLNMLFFWNVGAMFTLQRFSLKTLAFYRYVFHSNKNDETRTILSPVQNHYPKWKRLKAQQAKYSVNAENIFSQVWFMRKVGVVLEMDFVYLFVNSEVVQPCLPLHTLIAFLFLVL